MDNLEEGITEILEEFAGKVQYYELPKDLAMYRYKETDIERARNKILSLFSDLQQKVLGKIKLKGLENAGYWDKNGLWTPRDISIYNQALSDVLALFPKK